MRTICWVNSNLARYKNLEQDQIKMIVTVARAGLFSEDSDIISDCLWTISYVADTPDDNLIDYIATNETVIKIIESLGSTDMSHFVPGLRCIGNILTASDPSIVERCLWLGVLDKLTSLLYQSSSTIIKETLWAFSNITAGPQSHVEKFVNSDAFDRIMILTESRNIDIRKESLYVMCNAITGSDLVIRGKIYEKTDGKILYTMIQASSLTELKLIFFVLDSIDELLKLDEWFRTKNTDQSVALKFERYGGLDALEEI